VGTRTCPGRASQDGELVAQEKIVDHEVLASADLAADSQQEKTEQFVHSLSIADWGPSKVLPSHPATRRPWWAFWRRNWGVRGDTGNVEQ